MAKIKFRSRDMHAPADRTAKRLTIEEWFARYDALDLLKGRSDRRSLSPSPPPPADRIAVRA
jgi:hypothetical protein